MDSMKDVPTYLPEGTILPCMLPLRMSRMHLYVSSMIRVCPSCRSSRWNCESQTSVATALEVSRAQMANFRGNVQSRIRKLKEEVVDCTLLALAGLSKMDLLEHATKILDFEDMLPAVAQGAIKISCRTNDDKMQEYYRS